MKCPSCGENTNDVQRRRQNTAYVEEELNFITCCGECFEAAEEYWDERWKELYADQLSGIRMGNLAEKL